MKRHPLIALFPALFATLTALAPAQALAANQAPTVQLTAPAANTVRLSPASVTLSASAADADGSIAKVVFFRGTTRLFTDTTAPYSYTWKNISAGTYSLTAQATDNAGAVTTSAPVTLQVNSQQPPTVSLTTPANNTTVAPNSNVTLSANASDVDGSIAKVAFFRGTTRIGTDFTAPFSIVWNQVPAGTYSLTAQATDNIGAVSTSAPVTLRVMANPPPLVSLSSPVDGSQFVQGVPIRLEATASDGDGIGKVEFFHDSTLLATASQPPFTATWTPPAAGSYRLTAKASDSLGATTTSTVVTVTVTAAAATTLYYIESDHLGTPRAISDESGKTVWRWANREPFGDSLPETDPDGDGKPFEFNLRFPGQYYDAETGLHYNFYRDYDAAVGRYVESDPIGLAGGVNTYGYVEGNPISKVDPTGEFAIAPALPVIIKVCEGAAAGLIGTFSAAAIIQVVKCDKDDCEEGCEKQYDRDMAECRAYSAMTGNKYTFVACKREAERRLSKCMFDCGKSCKEGR